MATLHREKRHNIGAACGQLRLKAERELARIFLRWGTDYFQRIKKFSACLRIGYALFGIGVMLCPLFDGTFDLVNPLHRELLDFRSQSLCVICPVRFPTLQLFDAHRIETRSKSFSGWNRDIRAMDRTVSWLQRLQSISVRMQPVSVHAVRVIRTYFCVEHTLADAVCVVVSESFIARSR